MMWSLMKPALEVGALADALLLAALIGGLWYRTYQRKKKIQERLNRF